jgi:hypothetical protein
MRKPDAFKRVPSADSQPPNGLGPEVLEKQIKDFKREIATLEKEQQFFENDERIQALKRKVARNEAALHEMQCAASKAQESMQESDKKGTEGESEEGHEFTAQVRSRSETQYEK